MGRLAATVAVLAALVTAAAAAGQPGIEEEDPAGWQLLGTFKGSASSRLTQVVNDLLFELENEGDLYQDLGVLSLGLGKSFDDLRVSWDNSFFHRVEPWHEPLPPGSTVGPDDLSSYIDVQSIVSRGRLRFGPELNIVDDTFLGTEIESGTSLTLARRRVPLRYADRPLAEVLAERDLDDFEHFLPEKPALKARSLLRLTAEGIAALTAAIARGVGKSADTERGLLFFDSAADSVTLMIDVGVPVPAEMFFAGDRRLSVGDRVRHVTFLGLSPVSVRLRELGLETSFRGFFRFLRETTIIKDPDDHVVVQVRDLLLRGTEVIPLKVRPEIRLAGILKLGYTFFEQRNDRARTADAERVYRIDLGSPSGLEAFRALLGEGKKVRMRPLAEAAGERDGAELLDSETRRGKRRLSFMHARLFSPLRFADRRTVSTETVETEDLVLEEVTVARSRELRKKLGRDRSWKRQFLATSQGNLRLAQARPEKVPDRGSEAVNLVTSFRDDQATGTRVRATADLLARVIAPHPVLDELADIPPDEHTRFFSNVHLSFGPAHMRRIEVAGGDEAWAALAAILLGPEHREVWATAEARRSFKKRAVRRQLEQLMSEAAPPSPTFEPLGLRRRMRLAGRAYARFALLQEQMRSGDCTSCLARAFGKFKYIVLTQMLLYELASEVEDREPGFHYEVFTDRMLRPATVSNQVVYDFTDEAPDDGTTAPATDAVHRQADRAQRDWVGTKYLVEKTDARLQTGALYLNVDPGAGGDAPCLKLRLFSDLELDPELRLRVDLRTAKGGAAKPSLSLRHFPLGAPSAVVETPFMTARYFYDVPAANVPPSGEGRQVYTLLLRVLNPEGYPVTEEHKVRFEWPEGGFPNAAPHCRGDA